MDHDKKPKSAIDILHDLFMIIQNIIAGSASYSYCSKIDGIEYTIHSFPNQPTVVLLYKHLTQNDTAVSVLADERSELLNHQDESLPSLPVHPLEIISVRHSVTNHEEEITDVSNEIFAKEQSINFENGICEVYVNIANIHNNSHLTMNNLVDEENVEIILSDDGPLQTLNSDSHKNSSPPQSSQTENKNTSCEDLPYSCKYCDEPFKNLLLKSKHESTHTGDEPFICIYCNKTFSKRSRKLRHERIHVGEKHFKCDHCYKSFNRLENKISHELTHTSEMPYIGNHCDKNFVDDVESKKDQEREQHTEERTVKCHFCEKFFASTCLRDKHELIHLVETPRLPQREGIRRRNVRTVMEKVTALDCLKTGKKQSDICREIGVPDSTLRGWIKDEPKLRKAAAENETFRKRKTLKPPMDEDLEKVTFEWFVEERKHGTLITNELVRSQAERFKKELDQQRGIQNSLFKASNGWLGRWKTRHGIRCLSVNGEFSLTLEQATNSSH